MEHTSSALVPVTQEQTRKAEQIIKQLRVCANDPLTIDCRRCRYEVLDSDCMDALMNSAANLLEELAGIRKENKNGK